MNNFLKFFSSLFVIFCFSLLCAEDIKERVLETDEVILGTTYKKGSKIYTDEENHIIKVVLKEKQKIMDQVRPEKMIFPFSFPQNSVIYYRSLSGKWNQPSFLPDRVLLSVNYKLRGVKIKKNTEIHFSGGNFQMNEKDIFLVDFYYKLPQETIIKKQPLPAGTDILVTHEGIIKKFEKTKWIDIWAN